MDLKRQLTSFLRVPERVTLLFAGRADGTAVPVTTTDPLPVALIGGGSLGSDTSGMRVISDDPYTVTAATLTLNVPAEATVVTVEPQDGAIRFRLDGQAPTSSSGHRAVATEGIQLTREEALGFRATREGGTNVSLMATSYGVPAVSP